MSFPQFCRLVKKNLNFFFDGAKCGKLAFQTAESQNPLLTKCPAKQGHLTLPDRVYSKSELLSYLQHNRQKCHNIISSMTDEVANSRWINEYKDFSVFEITLYNMRHVQHHAAQLNLLLRQEINNAPSWVGQTKGNL